MIVCNGDSLVNGILNAVHPSVSLSNYYIDIAMSSFCLLTSLSSPLSSLLHSLPPSLLPSLLPFLLTPHADTLPCQRQSPCHTDATCINNGAGGYTCHCQPGYTGDDCRTEINECETNPCQNGGSCTVNI